MTSLKSGSAHHLAYSIPPMKNCGDIYILFGCLLVAWTGKIIRTEG